MDKGLKGVRCRDCQNCGTIRKNTSGKFENKCKHSNMFGFYATDFLSACHHFKNLPACIKLWKEKLNDV